MAIYSHIDTPIGTMTARAQGDTLIGFHLREKICLDDDDLYQPRDPLFANLAQQVDEYFTHRRKQFEINYRFCPTTPFRRQVWAQIASIPYGQTRTYGHIASLCSSPQASRAVGGAASANQLLLIVGCHRVVAAHSLGGFVTDLRIKRFLLDLESRKSDEELDENYSQSRRER